MRHKQEVEVSSLFQSRLKSSDNPSKLVEEVISENDILSLLHKYDYWDNTRGEIYSTLIDEIEVDNEGNGYMNIQYDVDYYFGCADVNRSDEAHMTIDIELKGQILVLTGENEEIREPDEY